MSLIESKFAEKPGEEKRDQTLALKQIDEDYLKNLIEDQIREFDLSHSDYFEQREEWNLGLRDLRYQYKEGLFEHSSDMHVPYTLTMAKALHAKIFEVFSKQNFFSVRSKNQAFQDNEEMIKWFMVWTQESWMNRGLGRMDVIDDWIATIVEEGSGILKLGWDNWSVKYMDLDIVTEEVPILNTFADVDDLEFEQDTETKTKMKDVMRESDFSAPMLNTIELDDFKMPPGQKNPQLSPWVMHRVFLTDGDLKQRAKRKKFDKSRVEEALEGRRSFIANRDTQNNGNQRNSRQAMRELEGVEGMEYAQSANRWSEGLHTIWEWHGKAYVSKLVNEDVMEDINELPQDVVIWYHADMRHILGWTYLYRVSPSGRRPFYKSDFMRSKQRAFGIGLGELLWSINNHIDGVHNLKLDNGVLASLQFGLYRAGSTLKPDTFKLRPGDLVPVEDPNDVKFMNFPYLGNFGENEEAILSGYGERLTTVNDINLGNFSARGVAGSMRNATGASFVDKQGNIQLNPHLSRIAREYKRLLEDLFILVRSRMNGQISFRVTGEDGKGIFGEISPQDLRGNYDFDLDIDLAAASDAENQQRASLLVQNLLNPMYMQLGIVQPGNHYEALKELLIRNGVRYPDKFITKPDQYKGPPLSNEVRLLKVLTGQGDSPQIENTVRPEEDHELALAYLDKFAESVEFGYLDKVKLAAFSALRDKHEEFLSMLQNAPGVPNRSGTQMPGEGGLGPLDPAAAAADPTGSEGGPLGSPMGEVNGPVR